MNATVVAALVMAGVSLIGAGLAFLAALGNILFTWLRVPREQQARVEAEMRLQTFTLAAKSASDAVCAVSEFFHVVDLAVGKAVLGASLAEIEELEPEVRRAHMAAHGAGLMVPPCPDQPLDAARRAISEAERAVGRIRHQAPAPQERAEAHIQAMARSYAAVQYLRSYFGRWRRAMWKQLLGPDPLLEKDDPGDDSYFNVPEEWVRDGEADLRRLESLGRAD